MPASPFPFLKPGFVKRKRGNKLEHKAVPCFYIRPSPNRPRDSMRVMLRSGAMIDSRHVTWACTPSLTPVPDYPVGSMIGRGRGRSKTAELRSQEMEPTGVESDAMEWSPTRSGRTNRTSRPREATLNQSTSRTAAVRAKMRTKNCTSSFSAPRHQLLRLLLRGGPRDRHR